MESIQNPNLPQNSSTKHLKKSNSDSDALFRRKFFLLYRAKLGVQLGPIILQTIY